jgi:predicted nucleic acid-binding protein
MPNPPKIYIESCPIIDMAKHKAKISLGTSVAIQAQRENNVWFCNQILKAARNGDVRVYSSALSAVECTHVEPGQPVPSIEIQDFFNMLLSSGRSGITRVQPTETIQMLAKNLKWKEAVALGGMDAIHVATALQMECEEFITTDGKIYRNRSKLGHSKMTIIQACETQLLPNEYRQSEFGDGALGEKGK